MVTLIVADLVFIALGENVTVKVVLPKAPIVELGGVVMVKSPALAPVIVIAPIVKGILPELIIVKVLVTIEEPKSVQLVVVGVTLPLTIVVLFPWIVIP